MYNTTVDQMKSTEEKVSILDGREQISMSKEDDNSKNQIPTMNFWGRGAYCDDLSFSEFNDF